MKVETLNIKVQFTEPLLATASGNKELHSEFQVARAAEFRGEQSEAELRKKIAEELGTMPPEEIIDKTSTVFVRDENGLFVWDYQWRGYFKEQVGALIELGDLEKISKWMYKRVVDNTLFIKPRRIYLREPDGAIIQVPHGSLERPLRASTMQGERVALARSEFVRAGTRCEFQIHLLHSTNKNSAWGALNLEVVQSALTMGGLKGTGQWRGGGWGTFTWEEAKA